MNFSIELGRFYCDGEVWPVSTRNFDRQWSYSIEKGKKMLKKASFRYLGQFGQQSKQMRNDLLETFCYVLDKYLVEHMFWVLIGVVKLWHNRLRT